jgi:predicted metal-dependent RNase
MHWFGAVAPTHPRVMLTHGENEARDALAQCIQKKYGIACEKPGLEETVQL